jgi:hypothetical protein
MTKHNPHQKIKFLSCMASNFLPVTILSWREAGGGGWEGHFQEWLTEWGRPFPRVGCSSSSDVKKHQEKAAYSIACPCFLMSCLSVAAAGILSRHQTPWSSGRNCPRISQALSTGLGWLRNPASWMELLQGSLPLQHIDGHCCTT